MLSVSRIFRVSLGIKFENIVLLGKSYILKKFDEKRKERNVFDWIKSCPIAPGRWIQNFAHMNRKLIFFSRFGKLMVAIY